MITGNVIYLSLLILVFLAMLLRWPTHKRKKALLSLVGWVGIIFIIIGGYSFRHELLDNRIVASLIPGYGYTDSAQALNFKKALNGHFYITAKINNTSIKFLVDTGASDTTLSQIDAKKLGLDVDNLLYTKSYNTANGVVLGAPIKIEEMKVGRFIIKDTNATVNQSEMTNSLLGMSTLANFSLSITNDTLTIYEE